MEADRTLATSRHFDAPPAAVFDALRDAERLARWWGPSGFRNEFDAFDFRPGGEWRFLMIGPDGARYPNDSVFGDIDPDRRVVVRHRSAPRFELTITLEADEGGTLVQWAQCFETQAERDRVAAIAIPGNEQNLDRLDAELRRDEDAA